MKRLVLFVSLALALLGPATLAFAAIVPGTGGAGGTAAATSISDSDWETAELKNWAGFAGANPGDPPLAPAKDKQRLTFQVAGTYYTFYLEGYIDSSSWQTAWDSVNKDGGTSDSYVFLPKDSDVTNYYVLLMKVCNDSHAKGCFGGSTKYRGFVAKGTPPSGAVLNLKQRGYDNGALLDGGHNPRINSSTPIGQWLDAYTHELAIKGGFGVGGSGIEQQDLINAGLQKNEISLTNGIEDAIFSKVFDLIGGMARGAIAAARASVDQNGIFDPATASGGELRSAWKVVRDIADGFFVIILLFIAFTNVSRFNIEYYTIRSLLPKFAAAVVLVNLGFFIGSLIIDVANVLTRAFLTLSFATIKDGVDPVFNGLSSIAQSGTVTIASLIIVIIAFLAAILLWFLLIVRLAMLSVLLIISPMAFVSNVLPATAGFFRWWWNQFVKYAMMAPIIAFILKIGQVLAQAPATPPLYIGPLLAAFSVILAVIMATMFGGKLMGAASALVTKAGVSVGGAAYRGSGLASARENMASRRALNQQRRGAGLTDFAGTASRGRLGTVGAREQLDAATRGKMSKDVAALGTNTLEGLAQHGNRWERDQALNELVAREGAGGLDRLNAASLSGRFSPAGLAQAADTIASTAPHTLDSPIMRDMIDGPDGLRANGHLGNPKYDSSTHFVERMAPEDYAKLGAGSIGNLPPQALQAMNLNERTMDMFLRGRHTNSILPQRFRDETARFFATQQRQIQQDLSRGVISQGAANRRYVDLQQSAATFASRLSRTPTARGGTEGVFHNLSGEQQKEFVRHMLDNSSMADQVVPVPVPDYGTGGRGAAPPPPPNNPRVGGGGGGRVVARPAPTPTGGSTIGRAGGQRALPAAGQSLASTDPSRTAPTPPPSESRPEDFQPGGRYAPPDTSPAPVTATAGESTPAAPAPAASSAASASASNAGAAPAPRSPGSVSIGLAADGSVAPRSSTPPAEGPRPSTAESFAGSYGGLTREEVIHIQQNIVPEIRGLKPTQQRARVLQAAREYPQFAQGVHSDTQAAQIAARIISQTGRLK